MEKIMKGNHLIFLFIISISHLYAQDNCTLKFRKIEKSTFWTPKYSDNMDSCIQSRIYKKGANPHIWMLPENLIDSVEDRNDTLYVRLIYDGLSVCADSATSYIRMTTVVGRVNKKRHFSIIVPICENLQIEYDYLIIESFGRCFLFKKKKKHLFVLIGIKDIEIDLEFCKSRKITINYDCIIRG